MGKSTKSEGKCIFCNKTYTQAGINRHLKTHLDKKALENKSGSSFLLKVQPDPSYYYETPPYFLSIWVDGNNKFKYLDDYLRGIWLECCGHLSSFTDPKKARQSGMWNYFEAEELFEQGRMDEYESLMENAKGEIPMSRKTKDAFHKNQKIYYDYDFGSTTKLLITVVEAYPFKADDSLVLLSRNEPPKIVCQSCKKQPAIVGCEVCSWDENADSIFCSKCSEKHEEACEDFADYSNYPVVNSPRMGVCGYEGGTIDTRRDGVLSVA